MAYHERRTAKSDTYNVGVPLGHAWKGVKPLLAFYKTVQSQLQRIQETEPGCWVSLVNPTEAELLYVIEQLSVDPGMLKAALDEEETSRIEMDGGQTLIIIDAPMSEKDAAVTYSTLPMGIIVTENNIITVCLKETSVLREFAEGAVKGINTAHRTRFIFTLLLRVANRFLQYLRQIDKISSFVERQLYKSQRNKELIQLLDLEKSLVYFTTSLKANEVTLEKLLRGRLIKLYDEDQDLLEDVLIEIRQAIEMANIYSSILSGMMDAFASVISNNLNVIMKVLTSITILITIPNIVFSFYGMNVTNLPLPEAWFPIVLALGLMVVIGILLKKKDLF